MIALMKSPTNAETVYAGIAAGLSAGQTVTVIKPQRVTHVSARIAKAWADVGQPFFKLSADGALLMKAGKSYVRLTCGDALLVRIRIS